MAVAPSWWAWQLSLRNRGDTAGRGGRAAVEAEHSRFAQSRRQWLTWDLFWLAPAAGSFDRFGDMAIGRGVSEWPHPGHRRPGRSSLSVGRVAGSVHG